MVSATTTEVADEDEEKDDEEKDEPILGKDSTASTGLTKLALSAMDHNLRAKKTARATAQRIASMPCTKK